MNYRTRTYIAGDWTGDKNLIDQLYKWNNGEKWSLSFSDAHELTQARDTSLPCTIKRSLSERLDISKTFVLIVGDKTDVLTKGSCQYCNNYSSYGRYCVRGRNVDYRSFIQYECEKADRDGLKLVVLYNAAAINRQKCPELLRNKGYHVAAKKWDDGRCYWNYQAIKAAIVD